MDFNRYQNMSKRFARYQNSDVVPGLAYLAMGLTGEAGEVANKIKKVFRDHNGIVTQEVREAILDELGDTLWYLSQIVTELNAYLDLVAMHNIGKLTKRVHSDTISGEGDNR